MTSLDRNSLLALGALLRSDNYQVLQSVPFAAHHAHYSARHLDSLIEEERKLIAAVEEGEPVLYAYSLNPEYYARGLSRRQRLLGELFLYGRALPRRVVLDELPEYLDYVGTAADESDQVSFPLRLVPVYDLLCLADPIDATDDAHVFLHNDSIQMARYLRDRPALRGRRVADIGTGSGILAAMASRQGAVKFQGIETVVPVQFVRYVIVGVISNLVLYLLYLLLTYLGMNYKLAMTLLYGLGVVQTFFFNKRWSFGHRGGVDTAFRRYVMTYASGYVLNLVLLTLLVDFAGVPHQIAQGGIFIGLALVLFLAQKYWVFEKAEGT